MFARVLSLGLLGMEAYEVTAEADVVKAFPSFNIVGLPDASVRESGDRVRSAIQNCSGELPAAKIVVNLAPADVKKVGSVYDLPIMLSLMLASNMIDIPFSDENAYVGELSLSGEIKAIDGVLPMAIKAKQLGIKRFYIPYENAAEASVVKGIEIYPIKNVNDLIEHYKYGVEIPKVDEVKIEHLPQAPILDFADVKGQHAAKRALEIAAAGGHNVIMVGAPGSGKSMLAKRLCGILPDMSFDEAIETTKIHSVAGLLPRNVPLITQRPFRSPHHTVSPAALSGGGSMPKPGEVSLAHNGVLFLDELPEFSRQAIEVLRQPIEDKKVTISRVSGTLSYPCSLMLVAAMNPCPCGYYGSTAKQCRCTPKQVAGYLSRISGPLLDRIDLHIEVMPVEYESLTSNQKEETSAEIKARVNKARQVQLARFSETGAYCNAALTESAAAKVCVLSESADRLLKRSFEKLDLSARAYSRIIKVARTIADMEQSELIEAAHISEAIQYRSLDRKYWQKV